MSTFEITMGAAVGFDSSVSSCVYQQMTGCCKFFITLSATVWFITSMCSLMYFQTILCAKCLATLSATEWFFTSMCSFMFLPCFFSIKFFHTIENIKMDSLEPYRIVLMVNGPALKNKIYTMLLA